MHEFIKLIETINNLHVRLVVGEALGLHGISRQFPLEDVFCEEFWPHVLLKVLLKLFI